MSYGEWTSAQPVTGEWSTGGKQSVALPDPNVDPIMYDLLYGIQEILCRVPRYVEAERYFKGEVKEWFADPRIEAILRASGEYYRFPFAKVPVKTLANRVKLHNITVDEPAADIVEEDPVDGEEMPTGETLASPLQETFDEAWRANNGRTAAKRQHLKTFMYGDAYMIVWPTVDAAGDGQIEDDGNEDNDVLMSGVRLTYLSPLTTIVIYDPRDERRALYAVEYWREKEYYRAELYYRDTLHHFITAQPRNRGFSATDWVPYEEEVRERDATGDVITVIPAVEENVWGEIPVKHSRTELPYGVPVHKDAYGPQNAIAKMLVGQISTSDAQGWPARFGLTDPQAALDANLDDVHWDDDAQRATDGIKVAKRENSGLKARPGTVEILQGIKSLVQLSPADPEVFLKPAEMYLEFMSVLTDTPLYAFRPGGEQPSGKARQIADTPMEASKEDQQEILTDFWSDVAQLMILMITGEKPPIVQVHWAPSMMATGKEDWETIAIKLAAGVPFEDAMIEAGYDAEVVAKWAAEKTKRQKEMKQQMEAAGVPTDENGKPVPPAPGQQPPPPPVGGNPFGGNQK